MCSQSGYLCTAQCIILTRFGQNDITPPACHRVDPSTTPGNPIYEKPALEDSLSTEGNMVCSDFFVIVFFETFFLILSIFPHIVSHCAKDVSVYLFRAFNGSLHRLVTCRGISPCYLCFSMETTLPLCYSITHQLSNNTRIIE